jgi:hypothetical protein
MRSGRSLLLLLAVALLTSCSAPHYKSLDGFATAVRGMKLLNLPLIEALKRAQSQGFDCDAQVQRVENKPDVVELRCHRKAESGSCEQHQYIYLRHPRNGADISEVVSTVNGCLSG